MSYVVGGDNDDERGLVQPFDTNPPPPPPPSEGLTGWRLFVLLALALIGVGAVLGVVAFGLVLDHRTQGTSSSSASLSLTEANLTHRIETLEQHISDVETLEQQQVQQLEGVKADLNALKNKPNSGVSASAPPSATTTTTTAYQRWISDWRQGIANGTYHLYSDDEKAQIQKMITDFLPYAYEVPNANARREEEFDFAAGAATSEYLRQRAVALGLMPNDDDGDDGSTTDAQKRGQSPPHQGVPVDYGVDCDNNGIDDFAVVHLTDGMVSPAMPATPFDLPVPGVSIMWTPTGSSGFDYALSYAENVPLVSTVGHTLVTAAFSPNRDDGSFTANLNHVFQYAGTVWVQAFMITNGFVAFGSPSITRFGNPHDPTRFMATTQPTINVLSTDLDFFCGGQARFFSNATMSVFTWSNVPLWIAGALNGCPAPETNTFQLILYAGSNAFEFRFQAADEVTIASGLTGSEMAITGAFAGTAGGNGPSPVTYLDYTRQNTYSHTVTLGSAFEWWVDARGPDILNTGRPNRKFYETWPERFDHFVAFAFGWGVGDFFRKPVAFSGSSDFFSATVSRAPVGVGDLGSNSPGVGGAELESLLWMNVLEPWFDWSPADLLEGKLNKKFYLGQKYAAGIGQKTLVSPSGTTLGEPLLYNLAMNGARGGYTNDDFVITSLWDVLVHELTHKWIEDPGVRWPVGGPASWGAHWQDNFAGSGHKSAFLDSRLDLPSVWGDNDFKYGAPKRPRGDTNHYSHGHITPLVPDPNRPGYFRDALDSSISYPDSPDQLMQFGYESCQDRGLDLFVTTPQALRGGISPMSLAKVGVIPWTSLANRTQFIVDTPRSINPEFDFFDLRQLALDSSTWMQNMLYCGKKVDVPMTNFFNITDVRQSASVTAIYGTDANAAYKFNPRAPLVGDEGDFVDMAVAAAHPELYNALNLAQYPINNTGCELAQLANSHLFPQLAQTRCIDVKTVAFVLWIRPGYTLTPKAKSTMCDTVEMLRTKSATHLFSGYGARGRIGDPDYIPKLEVGLKPLFRSRP